MMQALIFAAGLGTRLKPFTDTMPKALVCVDGKPLLQHVVERLKSFGFDDIVINVHHFADSIISFVERNNSFGIKIRFSDERENLLDTGGGLKKASDLLNKSLPTLIHNVDIFSNIDLKDLYTQHTNNDCFASLVVSERITNRYLLFDNDQCLKGWINKKDKSIKSPLPDFNPQNYKELAFSGIHVVSPKAMEIITQAEEDKFSIIDFYLAASATNNIKAYSPYNIKMLDIGKLETLEAASDFLKEINNMI